MHRKFKSLAKERIFFRQFTFSILPRKKISFSTNEWSWNFCFLSVLQNLADRQLKIRYVVAADTSKDTLLRITRRVSQSLGNGKVKVGDQEQAMLNRDITVIDILLTYFPRISLFFFLWFLASGLRYVINTYAIRTDVYSRTEEYRTTRNLTVKNEAKRKRKKWDRFFWFV